MYRYIMAVFKTLGLAYESLEDTSVGFKDASFFLYH